MADFNNDLQQQAHQFNDILNKLSETGNSTIFEMLSTNTLLYPRSALVSCYQLYNFI